MPTERRVLKPEGNSQKASEDWTSEVLPHVTLEHQVASDVVEAFAPSLFCSLGRDMLTCLTKKRHIFHMEKVDSKTDSDQHIT